MARELPEVSLARLIQEDAILAMCRRLWKENGLFSYNEEKVRGCLRKWYDRRPAKEGEPAETPVIVGVIVNGDGVIEASTCLMVSDFYYTDDWHLAELWNFVDEEYRNSRNAEALIRFGMSIAEKMSIPFFTGIVTNKRTTGKVRLYRRLLGFSAGAFFIHNAPQWKSEPMEDHSDLRARLQDFAHKCTAFQVGPHLAQKQIAPLLKEAAAALGEDESIWAGAPTKTGAANAA